MAGTVGRVVLIALAANLVAVSAAQLVGAWLAAQALFHVDSGLHGAWAFVAGIALGTLVAAGALTPLARTTGARAAIALFAVGCAIGLLWTVATYVEGLSPHWLYDLPLAAALVASVWASARPAPAIAVGPGARAAAIALALLGALAWGQAALREAWAELDERALPPFTVELVAAYPYDLSGELPAIVIDEQGRIGDVVSIEGRQYNLHRGDALAIASSEVRRVRWISDGEAAIVTLRLSDRAREAFDARSRSRASQSDAVLVDGVPRLVLFHGLGPQDRVVFGSEDRRPLWDLYERLTEP